MKIAKVCSVMAAAIVMCFAVCSCSSSPNPDYPLEVCDNEYVTISLTDFDEDTGYFTFEVVNKADEDLTFDCSSVTVRGVDGKNYAASTFMYQDSIDSGVSATVSENVYDDTGWFGFVWSDGTQMKEFEFDVEVFDSEMNYIWEDGSGFHKEFTFKVTSEMMGYDF